VRWAGLLVAGLVGCASAPPPDPSIVLSREERLVRYGAAFRTAERVMLGTVAVSDPRVARRFTRAPRLGGRFADPFLFDQRARVLQGVSAEAQRCAMALDQLPETSTGEAQRIEQELLFRMLAEEYARLDHERALPASAADLVRATVLAWPPLESPAEQRATESIVAWRLDQVRLSLAPNALSALEREDLVDALEELRGAVDRAPAPHAEAALRRLRQELDALRVAPLETRGFADLASPLRVHHGVGASEERVGARIASATEVVRAQVDVAFRVLGPAASDEVRRAAADRLARAPECPAGPTNRGMRALVPPPERVWACAAVQAAAQRDNEVDEIATLVLLHDLAQIGRWALELHAERRDPTALRDTRPLLSRLDADRAARLVREAATHPIGPIGGALAVALLAEGGGARIGPRARAWASWGDAPLDVVEREVFSATTISVP
jgi:hypothetical protein